MIVTLFPYFYLLVLVFTVPIPRLTDTFNPLTVVHALTNKPVSCLFESTSSGPASIHYHLANSTRTNQRSQSRIIRSSNLAITERRSSVHTSQSRYSFHLPFQPSSHLSRTPQNHKPFVCSSPSTSLFYRRAQSTAYPLTFHFIIITPATYALSMSPSVASEPWPYLEKWRPLVLASTPYLKKKRLILKTSQWMTPQRGALLVIR
jgi:hypothetical protein